MRLIGLLLALGLVFAPLAAEAQPAVRVPRVGIVSPPPHAPALDAFRRGLSELGYVEGQNVRLEVRQWDGASGQSSGLIAELIQLPVDVLVVATTSEAIAAKQVTSTIPIVAAAAGALVESGAVASLARPGGNVTGLTTLQPDLSRKRLDLLNEALPSLSRIAVFISPYRAVPSIGERLLRETEAAAAALRLRVQIVRVEESAAGVEGSFQAATRNRADAGVILTNPFWGANAMRVGALALRHRLPVMSQDPGIVEAGGLMQYGVNLPDMWRRASGYVDRILKGAKPADLPVEQPTKFELVINLKTAKALGLTIPQSVLLRADQVIQ
jgi:putative tryptophan/tyrosine transport system substrate-binding protein